MKKERYMHVHYIPSHVYMQVHYRQRHVYHTHALSQKERRVHVGKLSLSLQYLVHGLLIHGIGPRYLVRSVDPRYLVQGIGPKWFWSMVLSKA